MKRTETLWFNRKWRMEALTFVIIGFFVLDQQFVDDLVNWLIAIKVPIPEFLLVKILVGVSMLVSHYMTRPGDGDGVTEEPPSDWRVRVKGFRFNFKKKGNTPDTNQ